VVIPKLEDPIGIDAGKMSTDEAFKISDKMRSEN
jgi:hypothetical protein